MARPTLYGHRKFRRLSMALASRAMAAGVLDLIWASCYESGDPAVGSAGDVEITADWQGEAGVLVAALVEAGFLEHHEGSYQVHDFWHHAPQYVQRRAMREAARRARGETLSDIRRRAAQARYTKEKATSESHLHASDSHVNANGMQMTTLPSPITLKERTPPIPTARRTGSLVEFDEWYKNYPKKRKRQAAEREWAKLGSARPPGSVLIAAVVAQEGEKARLRASHAFCPEWPDPERWLKDRRWEDETASPVDSTECVRCGEPRIPGGTLCPGCEVRHGKSVHH